MRVFSPNVVTTVIFKAFGACFPKGVSFYVGRKVIGGTAEDKSAVLRVDFKGDGDGCQGDGLRSLTCVTLQAGRKLDRRGRRVITQGSTRFF